MKIKIRSIFIMNCKTFPLIDLCVFNCFGLVEFSNSLKSFSQGPLEHLIWLQVASTSEVSSHSHLSVLIL